MIDFMCASKNAVFLYFIGGLMLGIGIAAGSQQKGELAYFVAVILSSGGAMCILGALMGTLAFLFESLARLKMRATPLSMLLKKGPEERGKIAIGE